MTYSTGDAARIAGIAPKRLAHLIDRHIIHAPKLGQGVPRQFRPDEIARIALVDRLLRLGMKPTPAAALADRFHGADGILVIDADGTATVLPHAAFQVSSASTIIDLAGLRSEIDRRLAA